MPVTINPDINPDAPLTPQQARNARRSVEFVRSVIATRDRDDNYKPYRPAETWRPERLRLTPWAQFVERVLRSPAAADGVSAPELELIGKLRLFTGVFTGKGLIEDIALDEFFAARGPLKESNEALMRRATTRGADLARFKGWYEALLPRDYLVPTPNVLGELGVMRHGVICNHQTADYFERICLMYESGVLPFLRHERPSPTVLEIGGGYGFLAFLLWSIIRPARYFIVDIPESLLFSSIYLSAALPEETIILVDDDATFDGQAAGIYFIPNFLWHRISARVRDVDLAINTLSFHEMPRSAVEEYADGIAAIVGRQQRPGLLFEQNFENADERLWCNAKRILRSRFRSEVIAPVYTFQTRGFAELHALDDSVLRAVRRLRPPVPWKLKLRSRVCGAYWSHAWIWRGLRLRVSDRRQLLRETLARKAG